LYLLARTVAAAWVLPLFAISAGCGAAPVTPEDRAKAFFERYTRLERAYDPAVIDLYADSAEIRKSRRLPDGQLQYGVMSGAEFKRQIRHWIPGAAQRGARNEYRNVRFQDLGNGYVRITSERLQLPQNYAFPQELVVGPDSFGQWLIWEDRTEAAPVTARSP
jgi:hypothetical protein